MQVKEKKYIETESKEVKISLLVGNVIMYEENLKGSINKSLELISKFSRVDTIFPYTSNN